MLIRPVDGFCDAEELFSPLLEGSYYWPDTAQGDIAEIPCATLTEIYSEFGGEQLGAKLKRNTKGDGGPFEEYLRLRESGPVASRQCSVNGSWEEPDLTPCLPCPVEEFFCPVEQRCIDKVYVCDGCTDCLSGADEQNCCKPKISCALTTMFHYSFLFGFLLLCSFQLSLSTAPREKFALKGDQMTLQG